MDNTIQLTELNRTKTVSEYTGIPAPAFRKSRMNGQLYGVKAPVHIKVGRVVFYRKRDIEEWLENLNNNTIEA